MTRSVKLTPGRSTVFRTGWTRRRHKSPLVHGTILLFSNSLDVISNRLDESRSASLTFSNQLMEAQSTIALDTEQITRLNGQVAAAESGNQTLGQQVMDLTNQLAGLARQMGLTQTNLAQANKDHALLENRLRRDVAERIVVERKFNNPLELQAQIQNLKTNPAVVISAESIYAGLDVEVKSNAVHVISPD
jgi:chromosome segregation ATPase